MKLRLTVDLELASVFDDPALSLYDHMASLIEEYPSLTALLCDVADDSVSLRAFVTLTRDDAELSQFWPHPH